MIWTPGDGMDSQAAALRRRVAELEVEREGWVRLAACLARYCSPDWEGKEVPLVDGHVCVRREWLDAVPSKWAVSVDPIEVEVGGDGNGSTEWEKMLVVRVEPKSEGPRVVVPEGPRFGGLR